MAMSVWITPPFKIALSYVSIWAYGNHYHMKDEIGDCHTTYDSGIAYIFIQGSYSFAQDHDVVMTTLRYVGVLVVSNATMKHILF
jgi:hypothetical protein